MRSGGRDRKDALPALPCEALRLAPIAAKTAATRNPTRVACIEYAKVNRKKSLL